MARRGRRDAQLFVRLDAGGLRYGFRVGRKARGACRRFRDNVAKYGDLLYRVLRDGGALAVVPVRPARRAATPPATSPTPTTLRAWAAGRSFEIAVRSAGRRPAAAAATNWSARSC